MINKNRLLNLQIPVFVRTSESESRIIRLRYATPHDFSKSDNKSTTYFYVVSTKEPLNIRHFCGKLPIKIRDPINKSTTYDDLIGTWHLIRDCSYILTFCKSTHLHLLRNVSRPHEKLLWIRRVSNPSTSIDPGWLKISFLVLIQNAGFVQNNGAN